MFACLLRDLRSWDSECALAVLLPRWFPLPLSWVWGPIRPLLPNLLGIVQLCWRWCGLPLVGIPIPVCPHDRPMGTSHDLLDHREY